MPRRVARERRHEHAADAGRDLPRFRHQIVPVHLGHDDVHQHQRDRRLTVQRGERGVRAGHGHDLMAGTHQHQPDEFAHLRLVLDDQYRRPPR